MIYLLQSKNLEIQANYWSQVILMNEYQRLRVCDNIIKCITTQKVAIFGLSFKGNINDIRSANSIFLTNFLTFNKIHVNLYDPFVKFQDFLNEIRFTSDNFIESNHINEIDKFLTYHKEFKECLKGCNTLIFCNDHSIFRTAFNLHCLHELMEKPAYIFDCHDNFSLEEMKETDFKVFKLGEFTEMVNSQND